jgi:hypothetical protein
LLAEARVPREAHEVTLMDTIRKQADRLRQTGRLKWAGAGLALVAVTATVAVGTRSGGPTAPAEIVAAPPSAALVERLALARDAAAPERSATERRRIDLNEARMIAARPSRAAPAESADEIARAARAAIASVPPTVAPTPAPAPQPEIASAPAAPEDQRSGRGFPAPPCLRRGTSRRTKSTGWWPGCGRCR